MFEKRKDSETRNDPSVLQYIPSSIIYYNRKGAIKNDKVSRLQP